MSYWQLTEYSQVMDEWQPDTLLVVWQDGEPDLAATLDGKINPALSWQDSGLSLELGFYGPKGRQPFVRMAWGKDKPATLLEQRFVGHRALQKLSKSLRFSSVIWADGDCGDYRAIGEDFAAASFDPLYEDCGFAWLRIVSRKKVATSAALAAKRFQYQIQYRRWMNENPDELTSKEMAHRLKDFAKEHKLDVTVFKKKDLKEQGMNLLLAVGQASDRSPPTLIRVDYRPKGAEGPALALVGKGITFDTGGINVKPHSSHVNCMKNDMGGAALMANLFMALVDSGCKRPLTLIIPTCENLVAKKSVKPGAVLTARSGKQVIIEHTDCEGRLILADALDYTHTDVKPDLVLVAATLTTAAMLQYSNFFTPVYFADQEWQRRLAVSSAAHGENLVHWADFLPFKESNSSPFGLTNLGTLSGPFPKAGNSNIAAQFLKEFYPGQMIHCDIFASGWNWSGSYPGAHYGATGAMFNTLFSALMLSKSQD